MSKIQFPLVHLGGSGKKNLSEGYEEAVRALNTALEALRACRPHGRDYYPLADGAFKLAQEQHEARIAAVTAVYHETVELYGAVL